MRARIMTASSRLVAALALVAAAGCAGMDVNSPDPGAQGLTTTVSAVSATQDDRSGDAASDQVVIDGRELLLVEGDGGTSRPLARLDDGEGELVHASLRPGDHEERTVLAVARIADDLGVRFELRYLAASAHDVTDLYWFPWRLQIDEDTAELLDVVPIPVWSPDGAAVAWIEWDTDGTRLRTVGWLDHDEGSNPSDDATAYALGDVPAGTQLEAWEVEADGSTVLVGRFGSQQWVIRMETETAAVAMAS